MTFLVGREGIVGLLAAAVILLCLAILRVCMVDTGMTSSEPVDGHPSPAIRLAVLGNSDSHSYADRLWFPPGSNLRGGKYRAQTLQWTEILAALRSNEVNQGRWGTFGASRWATKIAGLAGIQVRIPRKQDYEYNFSWSGAQCRDLVADGYSQSPQLLRLLAKDTGGWKNGIIVVRIGINDLGQREFLNRAAEEGLSPRVLAEVHACGEAIESSVRMIRQQYPELMIVLVGILNNSDWPAYFEYWQSAREQAHITSALDLFDDRLSMIALADSRVAFFDDRAWFRKYWGGRDAKGKPDYRLVEVVSGIAVSNTQGDSPEHAILKDGHGGTLLNALWVRDFINFINAKWMLNVTPVSDQEIVDLAKGLHL